MEKSSNEELARHYASMLDSVRVIETLEAGELNQDAVATIRRNRDYLEVMLLREGWTDQDMSRVEAVAGAGHA